MSVGCGGRGCDNRGQSAMSSCVGMGLGPDTDHGHCPGINLGRRRCTRLSFEGAKWQQSGDLCHRLYPRTLTGRWELFRNQPSWPGISSTPQPFPSAGHSPSHMHSESCQDMESQVCSHTQSDVLRDSLHRTHVHRTHTE